MTRRLCIQTVGCQMNVLDSELVAAEFLRAGYGLVASPREADVVLFNTCSVRQHAEDKIYSALGRLKHAKERWPEKIIGVIGCMAQKDRQRILRRAPHVDLIVGPGQLSRIPELLARIAAGAGPQVAVSLDRSDGGRESVEASFAAFDPPRAPRARPTPHQAMVRVLRGCDKFCTYCIVPKVRGPEQARPAGEILDEVRRLADEGCLEVTLLGQTVNSYCDTSAGRPLRLADLLERIDAVGGLRRVRFVTNHPRHMTAELLQAVRDLPKVCPYLHVPAQSGSDAVLGRMKRGYTAGQYREMLAAVRETVPGAAVTSDFIVGFPGETEEDFQRTVELLRQSRFKNSFIFKYSPRPGTKAAQLYEDDVPEPVKRRRNNDLLAVQNAICLEDNLPLVGRRVEILVEGPSKAARKRERGQGIGGQGSGDERRLLPESPATAVAGAAPSDVAAPSHLAPLPRGDADALQLVGRTTDDRIVVFDGPAELAGRMLEVEIEQADAMTLFGSPAAFAPGAAADYPGGSGREGTGIGAEVPVGRDRPRARQP